MSYMEFVANFILDHLRNKFTLFRDGRSIPTSLCSFYRNHSCKLCNYRLGLDPPRNYFCIGMSFWSHAREVYWINCIVSLFTRKSNGIGQRQHYDQFHKILAYVGRLWSWGVDIGLWFGNEEYLEQSGLPCYPSWQKERTIVWMLEMTLWVILLMFSSLSFGILPILSIHQSKFVHFVLKDANNGFPEIYVVHEDQWSNSRVVKFPTTITSSISWASSYLLH